MEIRSCQLSELDQLIQLLDEEFIFGKGRTVSLHRRFPTVYSRNNLHNIILCLDRNEIVSALAMRQFDWHKDGGTFRGAMIGAVYTHPARRKEGLASRLLEASAIQLHEQGVDFGVLWSEQQSFYARLGWVAADCSVLGMIEPNSFAAETPVGVTLTPMPAGASLSEGIRQHCLKGMILRRPEDYRQLPPPAESVDLLWKEDSQGAAYVLLGKNREAGFLYELVGHPGHFPALWQAACHGHHRLLVNDRIDSPSCSWLTDHTDIIWQKKYLAMWLPLSERVPLSNLEQWHIPYFDRI